jgi:prepilin-type N-terminal cleavage/methylation domain-containing protein
MYPASRGYSLIELIFALGLIGVLAGVAVPMVSGTIDYVHTAGAARYMAARVAAVRLDAVRRSTTVAIRFDGVGADYAFGLFLDGNGNGLRAADVAGGVDRPIGPSERLADRFAGTSFGLLPGTPDLDGSRASSDGVRIGSSSFLSVSPNGSCTGGTLYVHGRRSQYAVRILGATGRVRFYSFDTGAGRWITR